MAKERTSAAFRAFLSGASAVDQIQQKDFQAGEKQKDRDQADRLAAAQRRAVAQNIRAQIDAANQRHKETVQQSQVQFDAGLKHAAQLQIDKIKAELELFNKGVAANKIAAQLVADATRDYRYSQSYQSAVDDQINARKEGYGGTIENQAGYARFQLGSKIKTAADKAYEDLASAEIPTPSPGPSGFAHGALRWGEYLQDISPIGAIAQIGEGIMHDLFPDQPHPRITTAMRERIEKKDLDKAAIYAEDVQAVLKNDKNAWNNPQFRTAINALNNIINRSNFSKDFVDKKGSGNLKNIKTLIDMLQQEQQMQNR